MINLCPPAIIYVLFSLTQIIIDLMNGLYNTISIKIIVTIMVTLLLNILCEKGLGVVSWVIVFIPFILMTVIVSLLLYVFGLDVATGQIKNDTNNNTNNTNNTNNNKNYTTDSLGNIIIYDPNYNPNVKPVYFNYPNLIIPNPNNYPSQKPHNPPPPNGSSSPAFHY